MTVVSRAEAAGGQVGADTVAADPVPVVFISSHSGLGGAERYLSVLLERLSPEWIRRVVCLQQGPFVDLLHEKGYPVETIDTGPRRRDLARSARALRRVLVRDRPAVVHANGVKAATVAAAAATGTPIPVIWFKHDVSRDGFVANALARRCAAVIGVSADVTLTFRRSVRNKVEVIPLQSPDLVVDRAVARQHVLGLLGSDPPDGVVALVGRLDPYKGHRELIAILPGLRRERPRVRLLFVGGDDDANPGSGAEIRQAVAAAEGGSCIHLAGHRSDAVELIAGSDVVAIPSVVGAGRIGKEGFSFVALEALAVGTPIVGYSHGALPQVVGDCGLLVPAGDRDALRSAILRLLADADLRAELGRRGRQRFLDRFLLSSLPAEVAERYRRVAAHASRQSA